VLTLLLSACASAPTSSTASKDSLNDKQGPTYNEKVGAVGIDALKPSASCPHDRAYEKEDWRHAVTRANACVKAKDWTRVEQIGDFLAMHAPLTPWGAYYLSLAASARKDYPRAQWMLELALKKAPNEGIFHYELGRLNWELGDEAGAIKEIKQASDLSPGLLDAQFVMGQIALQKDDLSGARALFRKVLAADSHNAPALMAASEVEIKARDFAAAESLLNRAISANPRGAKARVALAQIQELNLKKIDEALQTYRDLKLLASRHKLDESVPFNLDDKIQALEKTLSQADHASKVSKRQPSSDKRVSQ
jgi:tetratricopeptide (TPR) repeat protein